MTGPRRLASLLIVLCALAPLGCESEPAPAEPAPEAPVVETVVLTGTVRFADGRTPNGVTVAALDADHRPLRPEATTTTDTTGLWQLAVPASLLDAPEGFLTFSRGGFEVLEYRAGHAPEEVVMERRR